MADKKYFKLEIITPQGIVYSEDVVHVQAPGRNGRFGVLLHHVPSYIALTAGKLLIHAIGGNKEFTISGGIADISDHLVQIITETAKPVTEQ